MKGSEIYDSIVVRCLHHELKARRFAEIFHCGVLCMAQDPLATDHNIYSKYFEREAVRLGMDPVDTRAAPSSTVELYNERCHFLEAISFYLPKDSEILNAHIKTYDNLLEIVPELWEVFPFAGGREMTTITTFVMKDIIQAVSRLHGGHN